MASNKSLKPPPFQASISFSKVFRFQAQAAQNSFVTAQDMALLLSVAISATTGISLVGAVKIKKIEAWTEAAPGASVDLEFTQETTTFIGSPSKIFSDTCQSSTFPGYVSIKPPNNSLSGFWISGNATSTGHVVDITCSALTVIDFHLEIVLLDQSTVGQATTGAGMSNGVLYMRKLCGANLVPVSYPGY